MYASSDNLKSAMQFFAKNHWFKHDADVRARTILDLLDFKKYGLWDATESTAWKPEILDDEDTIQRLLTSPKSFVRFGDGELEILLGHPIPFQKWEKRLATILREALASNGEQCLIGLPDYYRLDMNAGETALYWFLSVAPRYRDLIGQLANHNHAYISTDFTIPYITKKDVDREVMDVRYEKIQNLFKGRDLVIFAGDRVFGKLSHNVFSRARSMKKALCPSKNAFSCYDKILEVARQFPMEATLCFILGPTATAAAFELSQEGRIAWDIGHIAKDYDAYRKAVPRTQEAVEEFFAPD